MIMKLRETMKREDNQNGFTLVELIIVMAILAILAGIAVPKYTGIQNEAKVKADSSTAKSIVQAARIQETSTGIALDKIGDLSSTYMSVSAPQSGGTFVLSKNDSGQYVVTWTATVTGFATEQTVTEGSAFTVATS